MKLPTIHSARRARRGSLILEAVAALALLAGGLIFTVHVLFTCALHRHASEQILAAQLEAANLADRVALVPYANLEAKNFEDWKLSTQLRELIPAALLKIKVVDSKAAEPRNKQINVQIEWPAVEGAPTSLQLSTWRFAAPSETQPAETQPAEAQP